MAGSSAVLRQIRKDAESGNYEVNMVVQLGFPPGGEYLLHMWEDPRLSQMPLLPRWAFCFISRAVFVWKEDATAFLERQVENLELMCGHYHSRLVVYGSDQQLDYSPDRFVRAHPDLALAVWRKPEPEPAPTTRSVSDSKPSFVERMFGRILGD